MHLVLRRGVLHLGESYIFTLHVTDDSLDGEGAASITLHHNMPPDGGECHLRRGGDTGQEYEDEEDDVWRIKTLLDRVQFSCSGKSGRKTSLTSQIQHPVFPKLIFSLPSASPRSPL